MPRVSKQLNAEYAKAPEVTRQRLYLETMQQVYSNTSKVMVDAKGRATCCICRSTRSSVRPVRRPAAAAVSDPAPSASRIPAATYSNEAPPQLESRMPRWNGGSYSSSSRDRDVGLRRDREGADHA